MKSANRVYNSINESQEKGKSNGLRADSPPRLERFQSRHLRHRAHEASERHPQAADSPRPTCPQAEPAQGAGLLARLFFCQELWGFFTESP